MFSSDYMIDITPNLSGGGSDKHNKGYFATSSDLTTAYPTAEAGDYAIVGSTDTVWVWEETTSSWVDTDTKGQVSSVNGKTGDVILNAQDVGAVYTGGKNVSVSQNIISSDQYPIFTVNSGNITDGEGDLIDTVTYDITVGTELDYTTVGSTPTLNTATYFELTSGQCSWALGNKFVAPGNNPWKIYLKMWLLGSSSSSLRIGFLNSHDTDTGTFLKLNYSYGNTKGKFYLNGTRVGTDNFAVFSGQDNMKSKWIVVEFTGSAYTVSVATTADTDTDSVTPPSDISWSTVFSYTSSTVANTSSMDANKIILCATSWYAARPKHFYYEINGKEVWRAVATVDSPNSMSFKIGDTYPSIVATNGQGEQFTVNSVQDLDLSEATDGDYIVWVTPEGEIYANTGTVYTQKSTPTMTTNDIWLNTSVYPYKAVESDGTTECKDVPIVTFTIATQADSSVLVTNLKTIRYNRFTVTANELSPIAYSGFSTGMLSYPTGDQALSDPVLYNYIKGLYDNGLTITDNNYTDILGTLTITDKGVASGFSGSNYINLKPFAPLGDWEMNISFILTSSPSATQVIIGRAGGGGYFALSVSSTLIPACRLSTNSNTWDIGEIQGDTALSLNVKYNATVRYKSGVYSFYINNGLIGSVSSSSKINTSNNNLLIGAGFSLNNYFDSGSIYLNSFNIKENGVTTFQGKYLTCNVVSTGSKVVDIAHKDCVDEIFNASGSALYYVLDTTNQTVTLPRGDIFGFITQALNK